MERSREIGNLLVDCQHTQCKKIKELFLSKPNEWIPLPEIIPYAAQYNARIYELRREGMLIENRTKTVKGQKWSWYRFQTQKDINLRTGQACGAISNIKANEEQSAATRTTPAGRFSLIS